ncbi:MAG: hypothetical protein HQ526_07815 [Actinobacteria bacterium]|nr:hypothetical protein [Actinomycetota bacterium]
MPPLAIVGLKILDLPALTGAACLTALLILVADFRGQDQLKGYAGTAAGCMVLAILGSISMPVWATVTLAATVCALLGAIRGFGGYFATAAVTLTAELLVALALRSAGSSAQDVIVGVAMGAAAALIVAALIPGPGQPLRDAMLRVRTLYDEILAGRLPTSDARGTSHQLMTAYVEATDRPAAPTRKATTELMNLEALARTGDLLSSGVLKEAAPVAPTQAEWSATWQIRFRPDGLLFRQAAISAALYGSLVWLVFTVAPSHPQWVLLGAVSATYPYARRSAVVLRDLLIGTVMGFLVLILIAPLANAYPAIWWVVLALAAFLACGAPRGRWGWVLGQIAFTVLSLSLLATSLGALRGVDLEIRLIDVVIGGGSAVVVALILAPRGLRRRFRLSLADLYEATEPALMRAWFLRCTDLIEAMRGTGIVPIADLSDWLNAARRSVEAPDRQARAEALRDNATVPGEPLLERLSPELPRRAFSSP